MHNNQGYRDDLPVGTGMAAQGPIAGRSRVGQKAEHTAMMRANARSIAAAAAGLPESVVFCLFARAEGGRLGTQRCTLPWQRHGTPHPAHCMQ